MNKKEDNSLVVRYYTSEKLTLVIGLLLIFWHVLGIQDPMTVPLLNIKLHDPNKFSLATTLVLLILVTFTVIEWKQSSESARQYGLSRIRFVVTLIIASVSLWMTLPILTKETSLANVPRVWYLCYLALGVGIGTFSLLLAFSTLMIRSKEEARRLDLPRIPMATRSQYMAGGPILLVLLAGFYVMNHYAPLTLLPLTSWLTGLPIVLFLIRDVSDLLFHRDEEGNRVSYQERIAQFKEIHSQHDYLYVLNCHGNQAIAAIDIPTKAGPNKIQKAIRQHFAKDSGNMELRIQTLENFNVRIFPKANNPENDAPENHGVVIERPDPKAAGLRVRVWPKKEDPPRNVKELTLGFDILARHLDEFIYSHKTGNCETTELVRYALNRSVEETLKQEIEFPLHAAVTMGRQDAVEEYLSQGIDVNERATYGWTPLLMATAQGYPKLVRCMLDYGANPDIPNLNGITPLMYAARYGNIEIAKSLVDFGAAINQQDVFGDTALAVAVQNGHESIARMLLSKKASVSTRNIEEETPLDLAYKRRQGKIARLLRQNMNG